MMYSLRKRCPSLVSLAGPLEVRGMGTFRCCGQGLAKEGDGKSQAPVWAAEIGRGGFLAGVKVMFGLRHHCKVWHGYG